jgi:hypothetical protein
LIASLVSLGLAIWFLYQAGIFGSPEATKATLHEMHESFSVGYWRYSVDRTLITHVLGRGLLAEKANGKFVVVYLTAENNARDASTIPNPVLKDSMEREHSSTVLVGSELSGKDLSLTTLNPGVSVQGYFVFDVPDDAFRLQVVLSGGYESKARGFVPIY